MLVDRPGRGYGGDYASWLVDGDIGELIRVRGEGITEEGIVGGRRLPLLQALQRRRARRGRARRRRDPRHRAPRAHTSARHPERHIETFRDIADFPPDEAKQMLDFTAKTAAEAGLGDYRGSSERRPRRWTDGVPSPLAHPRRAIARGMG